jgi:spore coat polysaccharide biosynthesis protein SpsF (cytidylyltransferase family)
MNLAVGVQARMSSRRLPGKVLLPIAGKPMLGYLLDRLERCPGAPPVVVVTSGGADDDPVAAFCSRRRVDCFRGDLENVASRFAAVAEQRGLDGFVRVCGDSPLLDGRLVERALHLLRQGGCDVVTNVFPRSYPPGQSVEAIRADAFRRACELMSQPEDFEHVTKVFYQHPARFRVRNFTAPSAFGEVHLAVDTPEHLRLIEAVFRQMGRPHHEYGLDEVVKLYRAVGADLGKEAA